MNRFRRWQRNVLGPWRLWVARVAALVYLVPILWMVSISFKPPDEWTAFPPNLIPEDPTLANYIALYTSQTGKMLFNVAEPAWPSIVNSVVISLAATVLAMIIGFVAAYGASRYGAGGDFLMVSVLLTRMLPPMAIVIPIVLYYVTLGWTDTHVGLILLYGGVTVAYAIWMLKGFIDEIPVQVEEAAYLSGASALHVMRTITLPMIKNGLLTTALFVFILNWTEFTFALVLTNRQAVTIPVQLSKYVGQVGTLYGPQAALGIVASIPPALAGYLIQDHLVKGFTFGAVD